MVGRQKELEIINEKLELALQGKSQVIGIVAEAGMGKSRLVAEVIRAARRKGFAGYGGACQSDGVNTPYLTWKSIWSAFFDVDPAAPLRKQIRSLEGEIEDRAPERVQALPLLNSVLDLEIPENEFTSNLEPQYRKSALTALFEDCLRAASQDEPLLIVVEDLHWIDGLSHDLLEDLAKALADCRICFVLAYRPPKLTRLQAPRLEALPQFTKIELQELNRAEAEGAIRAKLLQLYPARSGAIPTQLVDKLMSRAQGNPFYLEELLNYLRDRGLDPRDPADLNKIELPDSLHTLILSRIDQLSEREKTTLRVASIVGRLFRASWLTGYYPALGNVAHIKVDLDNLHTLDITPLDSEPDLAYLFKHIVTHEVTYESLPFALRAQLHEQLARYLEKQIEAEALTEASLLDTLVYHYTHSENKAKQRAYLKKAGEAALTTSAFHTAVEYFDRLLELTPMSDPTRAALALQIADAHYRLGDYPATRAAIEQAQSAAQTDTDRASALALLGEMTSAMGDYTEAGMIAAQAVELARASGDRMTLCRALWTLGTNDWRLGKLDEARVAEEESLALARELGDVTRELFALNVLGLVYLQTDLGEAERLFMEVQARAVAVGNRERELAALNNLAVVASERKDFATQREYEKQTLAVAREIGSQQDIAVGLVQLGAKEIDEGDRPAGQAYLREGLALALRLGALPTAMWAVRTFAHLAFEEGQSERGLALIGMARQHPAWDSEAQHQLNTLLTEWEITYALDRATVEAGLAKGAELDWDKTIEELLK
jgi:tetratricopeptide (TPR) repeat protein